MPKGQVSSLNITEVNWYQVPDRRDIQVAELGDLYLYVNKSKQHPEVNIVLTKPDRIDSKFSPTTPDDELKRCAMDLAINLAYELVSSLTPSMRKVLEERLNDD